MEKREKNLHIVLLPSTNLFLNASKKVLTKKLPSENSHSLPQEYLILYIIFKFRHIYVLLKSSCVLTILMAYHSKIGSIFSLRYIKQCVSDFIKYVLNIEKEECKDKAN